jgi:hypothetical protein
MNKLNLKNINLKAPYTVLERENKQHEFYFWSDFGIVYDISFVPNDSIIPSGAIEVGINNHLAETGDGKQQFRNRLFVIWFNNYENRHNYVLKTAEGKMEGQDNFMALIAQADNPRLAQALEEFEETAAILFDPPIKRHLGLRNRLGILFKYMLRR